MDAIGQSSLHGELFTRLRELIINGEFNQGEKIPERELCSRFGVSRTPLREALKVLAAEGLVYLAPNRGALITELTDEELEDCLPISAAIESLSGELACRNITDEEIAAIRQCHEKMLAEHRAGNVDGFFAANRRIHAAILAAARNPLLSTMAETLFFRVGRAQLAAHHSDDTISQALADHEKIIEALEQRQAQRLAILLRLHMENMFSIYRRAFAQPELASRQRVS